MRRSGAVIAGLMLALALAQGGTAQARDLEWCSEDPVFQVFGSTFHITTTIADPASSVSSIAYTVVVPSNAAGAAWAQFPAGHPAPTTVTFRYTGAAYDGSSATFSVKVTVTVAAADDVSVTSDLSGSAVSAAEFVGQTNKSFSFKFDVATH